MQVCISMSSGYGLTLSNTGYMPQYIARIQIFQLFWHFGKSIMQYFGKACLNLEKGFKQGNKKWTSLWWNGPDVLGKVHNLRRKGQLYLLYSLKGEARRGIDWLSCDYRKQLYERYFSAEPREKLQNILNVTRATYDFIFSRILFFQKLAATAKHQSWKANTLVTMGLIS